MIERGHMVERLRWVNAVFLGAFMLVAAYLIYFGVVRAPALAVREDNPRVVESALRVRRGRILDANGVVLAESVGEDYVSRVYHPSAGVSVGYYSFQYGASGIEQGFGSLLSGGGVSGGSDFWAQAERDLSHEPLLGRDIRLTIDVRWQEVAEQALGEREGAVVLMSVPDRSVRAMVSHPWVDANVLDEMFPEIAEDESGVLLNRAALGRYQPGTILLPFWVASGVEGEKIGLDDDVVFDSTVVRVGGQVLGCSRPSLPNTTYRETIQTGCPAPLVGLSQILSVEEMGAILSDWGFDSKIELPIETADPVETTISDQKLAIVGQEELTVTPLQVLRAWVALVIGEPLPNLHLVSGVEESGDEMRVIFPTASTGEPVVSAETSDAIRASFAKSSSVAETSAIAIAGSEGESNSWYLGVAPSERPRFAIVVIVENEPNEVAEEIGREILSKVLAPSE